MSKLLEMIQRFTLIGLILLCLLPVWASENGVDKDLVEKKPYTKQMYLELPAYLSRNKQQQEAKAQKKTEKQEKKALKALEKRNNQGSGSIEGPQAISLGEASYVRLLPYEAGKELDLWLLESRRFFRSEPVISPDNSQYAYSEVVYLPHSRQTFSKIYLTPLLPMPTQAPLAPSEQQPIQTLGASDYQNRYNPDKTMALRQEILGVGHNRSVDFEFRALTVVDWSASGSRLLFKQRSGILHVGLKVTDVLVYDKLSGAVTIYPELQQILRHYWMEHSFLPGFDINKIAWDIYPIGWESGSDSVVLFKAWAYDKSKRQFLGLWRYDMDLQRSELVNLKDLPYPAPTYGKVPDFISPAF